MGNAEKLYVHYFARDCQGLEELTHGSCTPVGTSALKIPVGVKASLVERDYIAAGTQRGPDSTLTLPPTVLRLHRPGS